MTGGNGRQGRQPGDIEVIVPRFAPANPFTKTVMSYVGVSRRRAAKALVGFGFGEVEFFTQRGATRITLHLARKGSMYPQFAPKAGSIAAVLLTGGPPDGPELFVFDTGRGRIGATKSVSTRSLDDSASIPSKVLRTTVDISKIARRAAHLPAVAASIVGALPSVIESARRAHGTAANEEIRVAKLNVRLPTGDACVMRIGRTDRVFDPPQPNEDISQHERHAHVVEMLETASLDLLAAWWRFAATPPFIALPPFDQMLTQRHVVVAWGNLCVRSLQAFEDDLTWPLALQLFGFHDGAAQFVRRVATGEVP